VKSESSLNQIRLTVKFAKREPWNRSKIFRFCSTQDAFASCHILSPVTSDVNRGKKKNKKKKKFYSIGFFYSYSPEPTVRSPCEHPCDRSPRARSYGSR